MTTPMPAMCALAGHAVRSHHHQHGIDFALCRRCGREVIRAGEGAWKASPAGFHTVWREFGRAADAAWVVARMARGAPVPRRREPRYAPPESPRDRRGRPIRGVASMFGSLAHLAGLIAGEEPIEDDGRTGAKREYVICLPGAG